jgi:uncharacterized protein (DUF305 family)
MVLALAGCGAGAPAAPATAPPVPAVAATPSGTDVAWLQLLIAMNERLLPVLDLAPDRAADPALAALAGEVRAARAEELALMHGIAERAVLPTTNPHEGHDMPGMVTADQLRALQRARGPAFDRLFAAALTAHLDQAARLCAAEQRSGADPATQQLARRVGAAVSAEKARIDGHDIESRR